MSSANTVPSNVVSLDDYEAAARKSLDEKYWAYFAGGGADEITLSRNRAAFDDMALEPRALRDMRGASTRSTLLGMELPFPVLMAPIAYQKLAHPDGELASVAAASALAIPMAISTQASVTLENAARSATAPLLFQLYIQPDRGFTRTLVARAEAAGYRALIVTVDAPVNGIRNREQRAGFRLPAEVAAVNLEGAASPISTGATTGGGSPVFSGLLNGAPTWSDISALTATSRLPVIVKGILSPADAGIAVDCGVAAIIVSNHGGRTLDTLPASIEALPRVAQIVAGRVPLLLDGGIRRGTDILKALALGADAVMIGRPYVYGLAVAGGVGVAHVLSLLRVELEAAMALTGCAKLADIDQSIIWSQRTYTNAEFPRFGTIPRT